MGRITTVIDDDVLKEIKIQAIEENLNIGEMIEKSFNFYVKNANKGTNTSVDLTVKGEKNSFRINLSMLKGIVSNAVNESIDEVLEESGIYNTERKIESPNKPKK